MTRGRDGADQQRGRPRCQGPPRAPAALRRVLTEDGSGVHRRGGTDTAVGGHAGLRRGPGRGARHQQRAPRPRRAALRPRGRPRGPLRTLSRRWTRPTGNWRPARAERDVGFFLSCALLLSTPCMVPLAPLPARPLAPLPLIVAGLVGERGRRGEGGRGGDHRRAGRPGGGGDGVRAKTVAPTNGGAGEEATLGRNGGPEVRRVARLPGGS
jgi:hypothetical protein